MPDYQRGYVAMEHGDTDTARYHFRALARMGIPEAQVGYGDVLRDEGSAASLEEAETWYGRAAEQKYEPAAGRLGRLYAQFVGEGRLEYIDDAEYQLLQALDHGDYSGMHDLIELYFLMPERLSINKQQLRLLTERIARRDQAYAGYVKVLYYYFGGESRARAAEILQLCRPIAAKIPGCYLEVARAYHATADTAKLDAWILEIKQAYRKGKLEPREVARIAGWLAGEGRPRPALALLKLVEWNYPQATYARARLLYDYPGTGTPAELLDALARARARGSLQAELLTGRIYLDGRQVPADPVLAERHLLKARSRLPAADYFLGELYQRGYLGTADPQRALEYLLSAARRGHTKADYALAEMFWSGKGVRRNPVYSLSFITLAAEAADADDRRIQELYRDIVGTTDPAQQQQAALLRRQEIMERKNVSVAAAAP
jgi:alginate biosynthesis protein AlgK